MLLLILTYGVPGPDNRSAYRNILRYIDQIAIWIKDRHCPGTPITIVLNGGKTNLLVDKSEAEVFGTQIRKTLERQYPNVAKDVTILMDEGTAMDLWHSLLAFRNYLDRYPYDRKHASVFVCCEASRLSRVRYAVEHAFNREFDPRRMVATIPFDFDEGSHSLRSRIQRKIEFVSAVLLLNVPYYYDLVEAPLRRWKIRRQKLA